MNAKVKPLPISGELPVNGKEILVKFIFTNPRYIPEGLTQVERLSDAQMDERHDDGTERSEIGRHRPDRRDTGDPIIRHLERVSPLMLEESLASVGYKLTDAHWFRKERRQQGSYKPDPQYTIVLKYEKGGKSFPLTSKMRDSLISFYEGAVWTCDVWSNPGPLDTVNFTHPSPGISPDLELLVHAGQLRAFSLKK